MTDVIQGISAATGKAVKACIDADGHLQVDVANVISGAALPTGQAVMASSVPVTMASNQTVIAVSQYETGAAVSGFHSGAAAVSHHELVADPGSGVTIYVRGLTVTNDGTAALTIKLETDAGGGNTAITPTYTLPIGSATALNFTFGGPGIPCTVHKNLGYTSTGTTNFTVIANGVSR